MKRPTAGPQGPKVLEGGYGSRQHVLTQGPEWVFWLAGEWFMTLGWGGGDSEENK